MQQVLVVAGTDPSSGAGLELATKFFENINYYTFNVTTAITAQNSLGVQDFLYTPHPIFLSQLSSISSDFRIDIIKVGLIANTALIYSFIDWYNSIKGEKPPIIFDPILKSTSDKEFFNNSEILGAMRELISICDIITPNFKEAMMISGKASIEDMIEYFRKLGVKGGVITGGDENPEYAIDYVFTKTEEKVLSYPKTVLDDEIHGTGCLFSNAITYYYIETLNIIESAQRAKAMVSFNIRNNLKKLGKGYYYFLLK
jgi:hydroxymethylpyrimidine/phosphomethylpyrimidine kinase